MSRFKWFVFSTLLATSIGSRATSAQPAPAPPTPPAPGPSPADTPPVVPQPDETEADEDVAPDDTDSVMEAMTREPTGTELSERIIDLETKLKTAETSRKARIPIKVTGYGDVGFFATQGDGTGFRRDAGHTMFPEHRDFAWVFYGDLLSTAVNTRGDVADLGNAPGVERFDSVRSRGNPTFLANELNVSINAGLGDKALFTSSINFTPRTGREFALGDSFDVDVVQVEVMPTDDGKHSVFVGKVDSVIGIEYKTRKSNSRFGITPSLLARYTIGTAVGIKGRSKLFGDKIVLAGAITNGSFGTEQFHFFGEVDSNAFKTLSGRAAFRVPLSGGGMLEVGASGQIGTQDGAPNGAEAMWFYGFDAELDAGRVNLKAQWLQGKAPGDEVSMTYTLDLNQGGYLETNVLVTPVIGLLARAEFRDAVVTESMERLYVTKNWRATAGFRLTLSPNAALKAEYLHNASYGGVPNIPDDVVTTSAVMAF